MAELGNSITYGAFQFDLSFQFTKRIGRNSIFNAAPTGFLDSIKALTY